MKGQRKSLNQLSLTFLFIKMGHLCVKFCWTNESMSRRWCCYTENSLKMPQNFKILRIIFIMLVANISVEEEYIRKPLDLRVAFLV